MKSHLKDVPVSDTGPISDRHWVRLVLDPEELAQAIQKDILRSFLREVLQPRYGGMVFFDSFVGDILLSVLAALAQLVRRNEKQMALLFDHKQVLDTDRKVLARRQEVSCPTQYWVGEAAEIK